ncbi:MAG: cupredoxin domain-containing protein [Acidimicrobiia bacterium]|nr:cupredoxin domain-containing protein [Acidimicrobiia bacterium]
MRRAALLSMVFALGVLLAACGSDDPADQAGSDTMSPAEDGEDGHMDGDHGGSSDVADDARRIEVLASSFEFDPPEIQVAAGENIAIVLTSTDILHDFTIDEFEAHVAADRGETEVGGFTAEEPGRYIYYCTVAGHREAGMEGTLVVA